MAPKRLQMSYRTFFAVCKYTRGQPLAQTRQAMEKGIPEALAIKGLDAHTRTLSTQDQCRDTSMMTALRRVIMLWIPAVVVFRALELVGTSHTAKTHVSCCGIYPFNDYTYA